MQVGFTVAPDGSLTAVRVLRSSGISRMDQAALANIRSKSPAPRPPEGMTASERIFYVFVNFPVKY